MRPSLSLWIITAIITSAVIGCGAKNFFKGGGESGRRSRASGEQSPGQTPNKPGSSPGSSGVSPSTPPANPNAHLATVTQLEEWCSKVGQTNAIKVKLSASFKHLCDGEKPTDLLKESLVKRAYSGGDDIQIVDIEPMKSDNATRTTSHTFAVGIKIPISIKVHFEKVAPKASEPAELKSLAEMDGATATVTVEKEHKHDGPFHVSGKTVSTKIVQDFGLAAIEMQSVDRLDQYAIKDEEAYLYTRYVDQVIKGVLRFDMVTAGLKIKSDSYLLSTVSFKIENLGFPSLAAEKLQDLATNTIKRMYRLAEEAKTAP